jgi:hypothetical protein
VSTKPEPAQVLLDQWGEVSGGRDDALMVDEQGLLYMNWPVITTTNAMLPIDLLLATTNRPTDANPSARDIAEAWNLHGFRDYFDNNQSVSILTFQDAEIMRYLK